MLQIQNYVVEPKRNKLERERVFQFGFESGCWARIQIPNFLGIQIQMSAQFRLVLAALISTLVLMVTQDMLRTRERKKGSFSEKKNPFCDCSRFNQMSLTDQITQIVTQVGTSFLSVS